MTAYPATICPHGRILAWTHADHPVEECPVCNPVAPPAIARDPRAILAVQP